MHSANHRGGSFEIYNGAAESTTDDEKSRNMEWDKAALQPQRHHLDETQQSWLLYRQETKKKKYVDFGCIACSHRALKWTLYAFVFAVLVILLPTVLAKTLPKHRSKPSPPDNYTLALHKALLFFNAQKSGKLPKNNGIPWREDSGLQDGNGSDFSKLGLVGGYYDAGDNTKFHFPMAFAMTMLSWSVIEYSQKYEAIDEYKHTRDLIKWGTDYLLLTFNSSASKIDKIYCQVGGSQNGSRQPDDHYCWQRPEDMDYPRPSRVVNAGSDLAGEMAAALAAASIVFRDDEVYSEKLVRGAETVYAFARDPGKRQPYSRGKPYIEPFYNSTGYYDEFIWGATWLYYATGNINYIRWATEPGFSKHSKALYRISELSVLSWDNKLPAAMLLLTRCRIFLNPGYPYEEMLHMYHNKTELNMCSYLQQFNVFNWTKGGMIQLSSGRPQPLQYVANTAFLASLFVDYLNATRVPGFQCGSKFIPLDVLRSFATSQINYILGDNPMKMSYVVGYGTKFPRHIHHRGASIPNDKRRYSCTGGWKWRDSPKPNPNNITGAMVGGPDRFDRFRDVRKNYNFTEPTLAGNAGLVAALSSLTSSGGIGIDKNRMFSAVPPLYPPSPPPPPAWKP
ncbi:endoglucanase 12-like [Populus alba x Populus x berolinensis]|uniref:Endoglucanase n=2 Tax=Populus TaxID=3689 RepID=A0A4U5MWW0_POPAL|nr:endoglucanase 12-like [Populus alba]KAJ6982810.1 endoglucanase 12-like [Populus alba x Populus x berolinensis]TKR74506.1 endo-1,4-beta-glucanase [Populus alba]